jgi:hypothetical protein
LKENTTIKRSGRYKKMYTNAIQAFPTCLEK